MIRKMVRAALPRSVYDWLVGRYHTARRLFAYPATANLHRADYDTYWSAKSRHVPGGLSPWRRRRAAAIARLLEPGDRVLDVGAGDGLMLQYWVEQAGVVGEGLDVSPSAVSRCRALGLRVSHADITDLAALPRGPWDVVVLSEVIEHLPNPEVLLDALRDRVIRWLVVSIPNTGYITHRTRLLLGRFPLQWVVHPGEHLRFWTMRDFEWWVTTLGFTIARSDPYQGVPGLRRAWPGLFAAGVVYALCDRSAARLSERRPPAAASVADSPDGSPS